MLESVEDAYEEFFEGDFEGMKEKYDQAGAFVPLYTNLPKVWQQHIHFAWFPVNHQVKLSSYRYSASHLHVSTQLSLSRGLIFKKQVITIGV